MKEKYEVQVKTEKNTRRHMELLEGLPLAVTGSRYYLTVRQNQVQHLSGLMYC